MPISSDIELQPVGNNAASTYNNCSQLQHNQHDRNTGNDDDTDDDNMTIIFLETESSMQNQGNDGDGNSNLPNWIDRLDQTGDEIFDERRRTILLQELKRIQRRSFMNFAILCSIPVVLFTAMIIIVFSGSSDETCVSTITYCRFERRTFVNAFTTRCLCDPIPVERNTTLG